MARRGKKSRSKKRKKGGQAASRAAAEEAPPPAAAGEPTAQDQLVDRLTAQAVAAAYVAPEQRDGAATEAAAPRDAASEEHPASGSTRATADEVHDPDHDLDAEGEVFDLDAASVEGASSGAGDDAGDDAGVHDPNADVAGEEVFDLDGALGAETEVHDLDAVVDDVEVFDLDAVAGIETEDLDLDAHADEEVGEEALASDAPEEDAEVSGLDGVGAGAPEAIPPIPDDSADDPAPDDALDDETELASQGAGEAIPADVGVTSTPEARALLLAEALSHAEMQEARYRVPGGARQAGRLKGAVALTIFALAGLLAVARPSLLVPDPPARVDAADRRQGVVLTLLLQAEQIEAFRAREQQLPMTLDDVAARFPGIRYVRSSNRLYQLIAYTLRGDALVYDSANPAPEFNEAQAGWRAPERS